MNSVPTFLVAAAGFLLLVIAMVVVLPRMEERVDEPAKPAEQSGPEIGWQPIRRSPRTWRRRVSSSHRLVPGRGRRRGVLQGVRPDEVPAD